MSKNNKIKHESNNVGNTTPTPVATNVHGTDTPPRAQFSIPFDLNVINVYGRPFAYRPGTTDEPIINVVLNYKEYEMEIENFQPKLILDCGANIGCSAVYFANKYPGAQIYSVEPQKENFKILEYNTFFYDNIHPINSGIWDKDTFIRAESVGAGYLGFMTFETEESDPESFRTVTISKLLADSGFDEIDLLKMDIEGAEKEVFSSPDVHEWLSKVKVLTIELHDRMKQGCSHAFFNAISRYKRVFEFRGENLIFIDETLKPETFLNKKRK